MIDMRHIKAGDTIVIVNQERYSGRGTLPALVTKVGREYLYTDRFKFRRDSGWGASEYTAYRRAFASAEVFARYAALEKKRDDIKKEMRSFQMNLERLSEEQLDQLLGLIAVATGDTK